MYHELKELFGKEKPSVRRFNRKLSALPAERQVHYLKSAYDTALTEWEHLPQTYRTFLTNFLLHDKQRTLDHLRRHTVIGTLSYPLQELALLRRLFSLLEEGAVVPPPGICPAHGLPLRGNH